jgi:hypothetical protein
MMKAAEHRPGNETRSTPRTRWRQMSCAVRRLHSKTPVGPAMVVGPVLVQYPLSVTLVSDDDVVEAIAAHGPDHTLTQSVRLWRPRRRG